MEQRSPVSPFRRKAMPHSSDPEYRLFIIPFIDESSAKRVTSVRLETFKSFASFRYDLSVRENAEANKIKLKVLGLKTPPLSLPATGHAVFTQEYGSLHGDIEITVEGIDGKSATVHVRISTKGVKIIQHPKGTFLEVIAGSAVGTESQ
jgi:hypothetical protein